MTADRDDLMTARPPARAGAIYLDYQATTPTDPRVVEALLPFFTRQFTFAPPTPMAGQRRTLWKPPAAQVAGLIDARAPEIAFTSCATESNNIAFKGAATRDPACDIVFTCATEHKCVLEACRRLEDFAGGAKPPFQSRP
jgi:cysteine desulfurase